jgi:hypothetical protein
LNNLVTGGGFTGEAEAMQQVFGKETVFIRSGGSIPIVGVFDHALGIK